MMVDDTTRTLALHDCGSVLAPVLRATTQEAPRNHDDHHGRTEHHLTQLTHQVMTAVAGSFPLTLSPTFVVSFCSSFPLLCST